MASMFIGDTLYMFVDIDVAHVPSQLLILPYCIAFLAAGATALDPSMRMLTEPRETHARTSGARVIITAVALAIPAFLTLQARRETLSDRLVLFGILIALTAAAVVRIVDALRTAERSEADLAYQASHDTLTGLPNRRMMREHLSQALAHASVDDTQVGLLFIDLDRFKLTTTRSVIPRATTC
jgi:diguanylate cyclase